MCFDISHATQLFFWSDLHDLFYVYYYVCLVFISSIAKGLAMSRLGGVITTKKCYFVDLIIRVLSTFE